MTGTNRLLEPDPTARSTWRICVSSSVMLTIFDRRHIVKMCGAYRTLVWMLRSALFWGLTQQKLVIPYRRFGTTYLSHLQGSGSSLVPSSRVIVSTSGGLTWPLKMGPIGCPETSVRSYQSTLRKIPEESRYHLHRGGSLKSHIVWNPIITTSIYTTPRI